MNPRNPALLSRLIAFFVSPGQTARATLALRAAVGLVFFVSGLIKVLYVNNGPGRFAKIGLPAPEELAYFVAAVEMAAGLLLLVGLVTRLAAIPLVIDMMVAIATTKLPLLVGAGPEPVSAPPKTGLLAMAYQARLDVTMLVACAYLLAVGAGAWSLDAILARRRLRVATGAKSSRVDAERPLVA